MELSEGEPLKAGCQCDCYFDEILEDGLDE